MAELQADFELLPRETLEAEMELLPREEIEATFEMHINADGRDAKINGVNTLTLTAEDGIVLTQVEDVATLSAPSLVQGIENEKTARENADTALGNRIDTVEDNLAQEITDRGNADEELQDNIDAEEQARKDADEDLQDAIDTKQPIINDLSTIRSNAQAGKSASDTIATYGDIVTHDVDEFATAAQGALADTALQSGDNVSELVNDADYSTKTEVSTAVSNHNTSTSAHSYIQGLISAEESRAEGVEGTLTNLTTSAKTNLVAAINEVDSHADTNTSDISTINGKIPSEASPTNQLADKEYVDTEDGILQDQIDNLKARGRFLALWNCATGLAETNPPNGTYTYQTGDYFIVGVVSTATPPVNYKPDGATYTTGVPSTTVETAVVDVDDVYYYDGNVWHLQVNTQKTVSFVNIAGDPYDNTALATALNAKQNTISDLTTIRNNASAGKSASDTIANYGNIVTHNTSEFATSAQGGLADTALQPGDNVSELVNDSGYLTGITSAMVTTALGYTPYNSTNPSGYITSSALNGYATESWVTGKGYITGIDSLMVTTALGYTPVNPSDLATVATTGDYDDLINKPTIPTSNDYWTTNTDQSTTGKKLIKYKATYSVAGDDQQNGFRVLGDESASTGSYTASGYWMGRMMVGTNKRTFLLGVTKNTTTNTYMCGIGAHSWTDAEAQTGAAWEDIYIQPDGNKAVYFGGRQWRVSSGWMKVQNDGSGNAAYRTFINTGSNTSPTWRTVLPNQASGSNSVLIKPSISATFSYTYGTSINGTVTANYGSSFGYNSSAGNYATALGYNATASGQYAIQIGYGTNSTANTMSVGLSNSLNVQLLDSAGEIPDARIKTTIARVSQIPTDIANKSLSNLTDAGKNIGNWSSNVTNCITEIPQDIKLELSSGTLTLKSGSKYYKCDGSFTSATTSQDYSVTISNNGTRFVFFNGSGFDTPNVADVYSGASDPGAGNKWFNTTNNKLYSGSTGNWTERTNYSLPLAVVTVSGGAITSIDQVFNGFGYIGSSIFVLKGVKGLVPNGRNSDGTLKNTAFEITQVKTASYTTNGTYYIRCASNYINFFTNTTRYNPDTNHVVYNNVNQNQMMAGTLTISGGVITSISPKPVFHAADYADITNLQTQIDGKQAAGSYVTTNTTQTIGAQKTFSSSLRLQNTENAYGYLYPGQIEFMPLTTQTYGGFIDFHYAGSTADYTSRIIEDASGQLTYAGSERFTATNATNSGVIAVKGWVNDPTKSTNVVHRTGDESIAGAKTFSGAVAVPTQTYSDSDTSAASTAFVHNLENTQRKYCITAYPKIKLELNNGTLTLKSGSVITKADGTQTTTTTDQSISVASVIDKCFVYCASGSGAIQSFANSSRVSRAGSGSTNPADNTNYSVFLNTTDKKIYTWSSGAWVEWGVSLPVGIVDCASGTIISIDEVFNGFGYIGNTMFVLPGVKAVYPNGFNADGTYNNGIVNVTTIAYTTRNSNYDNLGLLFANGLLGVTVPMGEVDELPTTALGGYYVYLKPANKFYLYNNNTWNESIGWCLGPTFSKTNNGIENFTPPEIFRLASMKDVKASNITAEDLYPVGSVYFGTQAVCPIAALIPNSTWTLKGTKILTDMASTAGVVGNGTSLGLTDGTNYVGAYKTTPGGSPALMASTYGYDVAVGTTIVAGGTAPNQNAAIGMTTDSTKSGVVADLSSATTSLTVNVWERTA